MTHAGSKPVTFDAVLRFAGLCGHVPDASLDGGDVRRVRVVMPRALTPVQPVIPHYPTLIARTGDVGSAGELLKSSTAASGGGNALVVSLLRQELTLEPVVADGSRQPLDLSSADKDLDFRCVPRLDKLVPASQTIDPICLLDGESSKLVAARVILEHGHLTTTGARQHPLIQFDKEPADRYAHEVLLKLSGLESLTLRLRDLDNPGAAVKAIVIRPAAAREVEIRLGNYCGATWFKEMWGVWPPNEVPGADGKVRDCDFEAFYWICTPVPAPQARPVPTWDAVAANGHASCHQAIFAPVP